MSWQTYVDDHLLATGTVRQAALVDQKKPHASWAASPSFTVGTKEAEALMASFQDPSKIFESGITVNGVKYYALRANDRSIYAKKGSSGLVCVKTKLTIIVATYDDKIQPGQCTATTEKLADYLISVNF
eukprot:TRINITY_DN40782_c0_g1_i1.p2 TRINITY_DN40782_c0_g1~~TRINITY_DN40782_c0_g1_i1.p2  ORF type:complete len:137 (-),score=31.03 TRINITY_DN40782_c0_g1_i1:104-490(-)